MRCLGDFVDAPRFINHLLRAASIGALCEHAKSVEQFPASGVVCVKNGKGGSLA